MNAADGRGPVDRDVGPHFADWWMLQSKVPYLSADQIAEMAWDARQPEIDRLRAENEALRAALGSAHCCAPVEGAADETVAACAASGYCGCGNAALLTPNDPFSGERSEPAGTGS